LEKYGHEYPVYENFSAQHYFALLLFLGILLWLINMSKRISDLQNKNTFTILAWIPFFALILRMVLDHFHRGLNVQDDLPLHLCRMLALISPMVAWFNKEGFTQIFIYIALAGTINAMITADPGYGFPHYEYFIYWVYHGGIVLVALFAWIVLKVKLTPRSGLLSLIIINVYFALVHWVNVLLSSNYMYSRHKPQVSTLMDHLGEWPFYILWLEGIALVLVTMIYLLQKLIYKTFLNK
jgi:hypothetical integral membrane protein (TIGR02206 family)